MVKLELLLGTYEGEVLEGKANGKGKIVFKTGAMYEGDFVNNYLDGKGKYEFNSIEDKEYNDIEKKTIKGFYEGEFKENMKQGKGTLTLVNKILNIQRTYVGDFKDNLKHGKGKEYIFLNVNEEENYKNPEEDNYDDMIEGDWEKGEFRGEKDLLNVFMKDNSEKNITNDLLNDNQELSNLLIKGLDNLKNLISKEEGIKEKNEKTADTIVKMIKENTMFPVSNKEIDKFETMINSLKNDEENDNTITLLIKAVEFRKDNMNKLMESVWITLLKMSQFSESNFLKDMYEPDRSPPILQASAPPPPLPLGALAEQLPSPGDSVYSDGDSVYSDAELDHYAALLNSPSSPDPRIILDFDELESPSSTQSPSPPDPRRRLGFEDAEQSGSGDKTNIFINTLGENNKNHMMEENITLQDFEEILDYEDFSFLRRQPGLYNKISRNPPDKLSGERKSMWILEQYLLRLFSLEYMEGFKSSHFIKHYSGIEFEDGADNLRERLFDGISMIMKILPVQLVEFHEKENLDEIDYGAFRLEFFNRLNDEIKNTFFKKIKDSDVYQLKEYSETSFHKVYPFISKELGLVLLGLIVGRLLSTDNGTIYSDARGRAQKIKPFRFLLPMSMMYSMLFFTKSNEGAATDPISIMACYANDRPDNWNTMKENLEFLDSMFGDFVDYDELIKVLPGIKENKEYFENEDTMNGLHIFNKMYIACFNSYFQDVFKHKDELYLFLYGFQQIFKSSLIREKGKFIRAIYPEEKIEFMNNYRLFPNDFHALYTPNEFSIELFKKNIVYKFIGLNESTKQIKEWFDKFIEEIDETSAKRILLFCCNQLVLPLDEYIVEVNLNNEYGRLTQAHTCFNQIELYKYENYEIFKSNLLIALASAEGFVAGKKMKQCPNKKKHKSKLLKRLEAIEKLNKKKRKIKHSKKKKNIKHSKKNTNKKAKLLSKKKKK